MNQIAPKGIWRARLRNAFLLVAVWACVAVPAGSGSCDSESDGLNTAICHSLMAPVITIGMVVLAFQ